VLLIDGVRGVLAQTGTPVDVVQQIVQVLELGKSDVQEGGDISAPPAAAYGDSPTAQELQLHAGKAHGHVIEAMTQMVAGLEKYQESVRAFERDVKDTDATIGTDLSRRTARVEGVDPATVLAAAEACLSPTGFETNAACAAPSTGD
jgi:hypothetical protein